MYKIYPKTLFCGQILKYLPSCQSTNDEASALIAQSDPPEGYVIVTDNQIAGRGQRGNVWVAQPKQNLTFSLILKPAFLLATEQFWLNMAVSLGVHDALQPLIGDSLRVKWPNDIYVGDKKLGGMLLENTLYGYNIAWSIIGIGLNINQTEFAYSTATSLQLQAPFPDGYDLPGLLGSICEKIEQRYLQLRARHRDILKTNYLNILYRYRETHTFERDGQRFRGTIMGVDEVGRLLVDTAGETRAFGFKEVAFTID